MKDTYRPDIDGLRAVAVGAVVLFHVFPKYVRGGFVGVDVFFVISGYLISRNILKDIGANTFSFFDFYGRRMRRIFPSLLLVLGVLLFSGWFIMLPVEYAELGKSSAAGIGFFSNFLLLHQVGYFDKASSLKPLLHLWSLGIEEQFYIAWPLVLFLSNRVGAKAWRLTVVFFLISFGLNLFFMRSSASEAFYLPTTRFWELLAGCFLASFSLRQESEKVGVPTQFQSNLFGFAGLASVCIGIFLLKESSPFPGYYALLPCLGTVAIIFSGPGSWVGRNILARRWCVSVGLFSYPLYLWHWPLLYIMGEYFEGTKEQRLVVVVFAFILSWATFNFLEIPLRSLRKNSLNFGLVFGSVFLFLLGVVVWKNDGFERRYSDTVNLIDKTYDTDGIYRYKKCFLDTEDQGPTAFANECLPTVPNNLPIVFLWGDSHAAHLYPGLSKFLNPASHRIWQVTATSCPPLLHGSTLGNSRCEEIDRFAQSQIEAARPSVVVLGSRWSRDDLDLESKVKETSKYLFSRGVKKVVLFGPPPSWEPTLSSRLVRDYRKMGYPSNRLKPPTDSFARLLELERRLKRVSKETGITYVSALDILCDPKGCLTYFSAPFTSELVSADYDHYTATASEFVVRSGLAPLF